MSEKLTPKQERFAQRLVAGESQSDAYRAIYPHCRQWQAKSIHEAASKLAAKVAPRVEELRAPVIAEARYMLKEAMQDAESARRQAMLLGQPGAAVSAATLKCKLNGLLVEERRNERRPLEDLSDEELERIIERAQREAGVTLQ